MPEDIRDKPFIGHDDVIGLNFIKTPCPYVFRRHFRQGLRSHIMEILKPGDMDMEIRGTVVDGVRWFPKARPHKIFRIFRARLKTLARALDEIRRVKITAQYLAPAYFAKSDEFVVDYIGPEGRDLMLCGFQEFVEGEIIDPWGILDSGDMVAAMYHALHKEGQLSDSAKTQWIGHMRTETAILIAKIKQMILEKAHVPDLAGVGNLVMVPSGEIKLVDMNNISRVTFDSRIQLDDRGYPVCDKSIEALSLLEHNLLGRPVDTSEAIYRHYLDPQRLKEVQAREEIFYQQNQTGSFRMHDQ
jgi:hypothetical protein